jgi:16S rRNA (cytosine1402-N4)-methyltransferase
MKQKKPIIPTKKELSENISSRSAKLRFIIKKKDSFEFQTDILEKFKFLIDIENLGNKI